MDRSDQAVGFVIASVILGGIFVVGYFAYLSSKEKTEQIKITKKAELEKTKIAEEVRAERTRLSEEAKVERNKVVQEEKTHRTEERSRILKDLTPWAKKKD